MPQYLKAAPLWSGLHSVFCLFSIAVFIVFLCKQLQTLDKSIELVLDFDVTVRTPAHSYELAKGDYLLKDGKPIKTPRGIEEDWKEIGRCVYVLRR